MESVNTAGEHSSVKKFTYELTNTYHEIYEFTFP